MKAVVIDDQESYRAGVIQLLCQSNFCHFDKIGGFDAVGGVECLEAESALELIIFDTTILNCRFGHRFANALHFHANSLVVALSNRCADTDPGSLFDMGVDALLPKSVDNARLKHVLRLIANNGLCMPATYTVVQPSNGLQHGPTSGRSSLNGSLLTHRQTDVLKIVAQGKSDKEVGRILGISEGTVRTHLKNIFKSLNVSNRTEAAYIAIQEMSGGIPS